MAGSLRVEGHVGAPERIGAERIGQVGRLRVCQPAPPDPPDLVGRVRRALVAVREPRSTEHLETSVPAAVAMLGFDRVVYARVCGADWRAVALLPVAEAADWPWTRPTDVGVEHEEHRVLVEQTPVVVGPASGERLLPADWCPSYLVVPVLERGSVVGLIHAGHRDATRKPSAVDRELLWTFAEALTAGFACARAGDALRDLTARLSAVAGELGGFGPAPVRDPHALAPPTLTAREHEVLELMAAGQTNGQIARRLVITEGTAKSHVKRIMRKLNAANRAEAVAAWIRPGDRAGPEPLVTGRT